MMMSDIKRTSVLHVKSTRRATLKYITGGGALAALSLIGCGGEEQAAVMSHDVEGGAEGGAGGGAEPASISWATGGTAAMTAQSSYPNPFTEGATACHVVATTTEGPCTTATALMRQDISEGWVGLPVRLMLKVLNSSCQPLSGVIVKVWHTNREGSYSGQTPNNAMCLMSQDYSAQDFFRGAQMSDEEGVVVFDTCYPGWYPGRAIHVHFQLISEGVSTLASQLFFPEALTERVFREHSDYMSYGQPNRSLSTDGISARLSSTELAELTLNVEQMSDGALLASKVLVVEA